MYVPKSRRINFDLFTLGSNTIEIEYDGGGNKLRKTVKQGSSTLYIQNYLGGIEYNSARLEAVFHAEGRVYNTNVGTGSSTLVFRYEYAIRDHLGNTRIMFTDKNDNGVLNVTAGTDNEIIQENSYYPFGMNQEGTWMNDAAAKDTKYQYNAKELNDDFGLNWSDYGARWYDAAIGRWNGVDPLAEKFIAYSPYVFSANNSVRFVDPNGMDIIEFSGGITFTGEDARRAFAALRFYSQEEKQLKGYVVNRVSELKNEGANIAISHATNILKKNGIDIDISLMSLEMAKKLKLSSFEYFLEIQDLPSNYSPGGESIRDVDKETDEYISATYFDKEDFSPSYVNWSYTELNKNSRKGESKLYGLGYLIAHEFLHQIMFTAAPFFGLNDAGKCLNGHLYSCSHTHYNDKLNLNADGTYVAKHGGIPKGPNGNGLHDAERILWWRHIHVLKKLNEYLKN